MPRAETPTYLGRACKRGHAGADGQCLRYVSGGACVECVSTFNHAKADPSVVVPVVDRRGPWGPDPRIAERNRELLAELLVLAERHGVSLQRLRWIIAMHERVPREHLHAQLEPVDAAEAERIAADRWLADDIACTSWRPATVAPS